MEHEEIMKTADSFKKELSVLVDKYKISVYSNDQYDGEERYVGEIHYISFNGNLYAAEELHEIFQSLIKE